MDGNQCVKIFNAQIRGKPVSFDKEIIPLVSDYLTENNIENSEKIINLIIQKPILLSQVFQQLVDYYRIKYSINTIYYLNKPILYYV